MWLKTSFINAIQPYQGKIEAVHEAAYIKTVQSFISVPG